MEGVAEPLVGWVVVVARVPGDLDVHDGERDRWCELHDGGWAAEHGDESSWCDGGEVAGEADSDGRGERRDDRCDVASQAALFEEFVDGSAGDAAS